MFLDTTHTLYNELIKITAKDIIQSVYLTKAGYVVTWTLMHNELGILEKDQLTKRFMTYQHSIITLLLLQASIGHLLSLWLWYSAKKNKKYFSRNKKCEDGKSLYDLCRENLDLNDILRINLWSTCVPMSRQLAQISPSSK